MRHFVLPLCLAMLFFALAGDWVWRGDGRITFGMMGPFEGAVSARGITISNTMASISLVVAFVLTATAVWRDQKQAASLGIGALVLPAVHSLVFFVRFYSSEFRNGPSHLAFLATIIGCAWLCARILVRMPDEGPLDRWE